MRKIMLAATAAAAVALSANVVSAAPAQMLGGAGVQTADHGLLTQVRWRGGWHHGGWHHGGWGAGAAIGAGIAGLAIGSALAAPYAYGYGPYAYDYDYVAPAPSVTVVEPSARSYAPSIAWCEQHYRSYDPASQTYMGYDGVPHSCP